MNVDAFTARRETPPQTLPAVLHDVRAFIHRFVRLTNEQTTLVVIWVAMTHALDAFEFTAYIHVTSPLPECGKTRLLEVLEPLVANPWFTARVSAAVLMRKVDKEHPTLLLDESDAAFNGHDEQYSEALRGMLNAGFHRNGKASVCVGANANLQPKDFSVFGPKVIAGIGQLPTTVASRSIPIVMKRRMKDEILHKWRRRHCWPAATALRERLAAILPDYIEALQRATPEIPAGLSDRAEDVLEPLLAIAEAAGGEWPAAVRAAAVSLMGPSRTTRETDENVRLELLADLRPILEALPEAQDAVATKTLLANLVALEDRPWAAFGRSEKPLTGLRLAKLLKAFDIVPAGKVQIGAETVRGYRRVLFEEAFLRYLGFKAEERENPNNDGPESPKTKAETDTAQPVSKTAIHPDKHWNSSTMPVSNPLQENTGCCEGGPLQLRCKLCRQSPTYWQGPPN